MAERIDSIYLTGDNKLVFGWLETTPNENTAAVYVDCQKHPQYQVGKEIAIKAVLLPYQIQPMGKERQN